MTDASPGRHFNHPARRVDTGELADDRYGEEQQRDAEDRGAADVPLGAQAGAQEKHRHDRQQEQLAKAVAPGLAEPLRIEHDAGEERSDHIVQARPVGGEAARSQPDESRIPAIFLRQSRDQLAHCQGSEHEHDQETHLPADPLPIHEDEREHGPDRHVVEAGVAK